MSLFDQILGEPDKLLGVTSLGFWKRYEAECAMLSGTGMQIDQHAGYDKLRDRGFM